MIKMITVLRSYVFYGLTVLSLTSCISPFEPKGVADTAGILVVEGLVVVNGKTTIKLSRTIKLEDKFPKSAVYVQNATVQLIDEKNHVIAEAKPQTINQKPVPGMYEIDNTISFNPDMKYALDIRIGNSHYRSDFIAPVHTPEIDEVSWTVNEDKSMDIMVSTHDPANKTQYYFWNFEEDWEYTAPFFTSHRYDPVNKTVIEQDLYGSNNRYFCWGSGKSNSLLFGSSIQLSDAVIKNKKIHHITPNNRRFSYLYSILVRQYGLQKEAYDYFANLQRNVDESGSLFAPQPSEKDGNIQCLSNPDEPVIGYIAIAKEITYRLFIDMVSLNLYSPGGCALEDEEGNQTGIVVMTNSLDKAYKEGYGIYYALVPGSLYRCLLLPCVDCTYSGGSKQKPDFWPNNHQ